MIDPNSIDMISFIRQLRKTGDTATLVYKEGPADQDYAVIICPKWVAVQIHKALDDLGSPTRAVPDSVVPLKSSNN